MTVKSLPPPNCPVHPGTPHIAGRCAPPIPPRAARHRCTRLDRPSLPLGPCPHQLSLTSDSDCDLLWRQPNETSSHVIDNMFTCTCSRASQYSFHTCLSQRGLMTSEPGAQSTIPDISILFFGPTRLSGLVRQCSYDSLTWPCEPHLDCFSQPADIPLRQTELGCMRNNLAGWQIGLYDRCSVRQATPDSPEVAFP